MEDINYLAVPREIKNIIASFLDDRAKRILRLANTEWFNIINYDDFTVYFARSSTLPDIVQTFSRYSKQIGLQFEKTISMDDSYTMLASLTNLTRLEIEPSMSRYSASAVKIVPEFRERITVLTALKRLNIAGDYMTQHIINHFPNLTHLNVPSTYQFTRASDYPKFDIISKLGNLSRFRALDIIDQHKALVFSTNSVAQMSNVSKVSFDGRYVFFPFSQLPNLEYLDIRTNQFDDFSTSAKLTWLRIIEYEDSWKLDSIPTAPNDFQQLSNLVNLKYFDVTIHQKNHSFNFLSALTSLEVFLVRSTYVPNDSYIELINPERLTHLEAPLYSLESILHLTNLRHLSCAGLTDRGGERKEISQKLTTVTSLITPDIFNAQAFPNLKRLHVSQSRIDTITKHKVLANLSHLESLHVETIDNTALQVICGLTKLTQLTAHFHHTTYYFDVLTSLTALKELIFNAESYNGVKHVNLLPALRTLTNLERLKLFDVGSDDEVIRTLESLPKLKYLELKADPEDFDDEKLSNLTNLQTLHWHSALSLFGPNKLYNSKLNHLPYLYDCKK